MLRLSPCKKKSFIGLIRCRHVTEAFDQLLPFTGLWGGFQLGNIHKHLALHCDEQIISYLNHIRDTWNTIVGDHPGVKGLIDLNTVRFLQFKAPFASAQDKNLIQDAIHKHEIFMFVTNPQILQELLDNILSLAVVIPSIETFHENMKYFSIGARIIHKHVAECKHRNPKERPRTMLQNLRSDWRVPVTPMVQDGHNSFSILRCALTPELAIVQLFAAALRDFPYLSLESPLQDRRTEKMVATVDSVHLDRFLLIARKLGFANSKTTVELDCDMSPTEPAGNPEISQQVDWRGGKPSTQIFRVLQHSGFLPQLYGAQGQSTIMPLFIQYDFIRAFFGTFDLTVANNTTTTAEPPKANFDRNFTLNPGQLEPPSLTAQSQRRTSSSAQKSNPQPNRIQKSRLDRQGNNSPYARVPNGSSLNRERRSVQRTVWRPQKLQGVPNLPVKIPEERERIFNPIPEEQELTSNKKGKRVLSEEQLARKRRRYAGEFREALENEATSSNNRLFDVRVELLDPLPDSSGEQTIPKQPAIPDSPDLRYPPDSPESTDSLESVLDQTADLQSNRLVGQAFETEPEHPTVLEASTQGGTNTIVPRPRREQVRSQQHPILNYPFATPRTLETALQPNTIGATVPTREPRENLGPSQPLHERVRSQQRPLIVPQPRPRPG